MLAAVVLAGGKSSRMGCDKSQLKLANISLLQRAEDILQAAHIQHIYISGQQGSQQDIEDLHKNLGPLAGIYASLSHLADCEHVLFVTVDMPLVNKEILTYLLPHKNPTAVYLGDYFFPLLLCNSQKNRDKISFLLEHKQLSIHNMLQQMAATALANPFKPECFLNANTPQDWQMLQTLVAKNEANPMIIVTQ